MFTTSMTCGYGGRKTQSEYYSDDWNQVKGIRASGFTSIGKLLVRVALRMRELERDGKEKKETQNEENAKKETQNLRLSYIRTCPPAQVTPAPSTKHDVGFPTIVQSLIPADLEGWKEVGKKANAKAVEIIKKTADSAKSKTAMCSSFFSGEKCRHGKHCRYAHTAEELAISSCNYGEKCKSIYYYEGCCRNNKGKVCMRRHPKESDDHFLLRTGLKKLPPATEEEMQQAFDEYILESNKPVKVEKVKSFKPRPWKKFENVQFLKKPEILVKPAKLAEIDFEAEKIRDKHNIFNRVRELRTSIKRAEDTINRYRSTRNLTDFYKLQVEKLEKQIKGFNSDISSLEAKLVEVENRKKATVRPAPVEVKIPVSPISKPAPRGKQEVTVVLYVPPKVKVVVVEKEWIDVKSRPRKPVEVVKPVAIREPTKPVDRDQAFDILKNKEKIDKALVKTEMCRFGKGCRRGKACRFAHSKAELSVRNCMFGSCCRYVAVTTSGVVDKKGEKKCTYKHPAESVDSFHRRIGV